MVQPVLRDAGMWLTLASHVWAAVPGLRIMRAITGARGRLAIWTFGPVIGLGLSSLTLLALWAVGLRHAAATALAPLLVLPVAIPARRLADRWALPGTEARDMRALLLTLLLVPLIVGVPFARVGAEVEDGKAYRAYFTADYVWRRAVVAELAKGDLPPANPFLLGESLHYYWLPHLDTAAIYRTVGASSDLDRMLLAESWLVDVVFVAFLYGLARWAGAVPWAAAGGTAVALLATSAEGAFALVYHWWWSAPVTLVRYLNIDAISRWMLESLPIDGLQRVLFYQPHHAMGYAVGFLGVLAVVARRRDTDPVALGVGGVLLGTSALTSSFAGLMLTCVAVAWEAVASLRRFNADRVAMHLAAAAVPLALSVVVVLQLGYVDRSGSVLSLQLNELATHRFVEAALLSAGPILVLGTAGLVLLARRRDVRLGFYLALALVCIAFYFFVEVRDHQHVYVGWRVGHLWFIAAGGLVGLTLSWIAARGPWTRPVVTALAVIVVGFGLPTSVIDIINTADIDNRAYAAGFQWTMIVSREELEAFAWLRSDTRPDARIQWESRGRAAEGWANIPAFAERRLAAGRPTSMVPISKYDAASDLAVQIFADNTPDMRHQVATALRVNYVYVGYYERTRYPKASHAFETAPEYFEKVFENSGVRIFRVRY